MIIRRMADAIRAQNWFTVVIEFTLVVAGVLVALQFDNWNTNRLENARAKEILERIVSGNQAMVLEARQNVKNSIDTVKALQTALDALKDGEVSPDEEPAIVRAMAALETYNYIDWEMSVVDELISSGDLSLVRDELLRSLLSTQRDTVTGHQQAALHVRLTMTEYVPNVHKYVRFAFDVEKWLALGELYTGSFNEDAGLSIEYADFTGLAGNPFAVNSLSLIMRLQGFYIRNHQIILAEALEINQRLREIGAIE